MDRTTKEAPSEPDTMGDCDEARPTMPTLGFDRSKPVNGSANGVPKDANAIHAAAAHGISGSGGPLPHLDAIQRSFGPHDVSGVIAHVGGAAAAGAAAMGAVAFAAGNHVAFGSAPSLHTAAHEAAHIVQQRGGVQLQSGVGQVGDSYEQHADAVADRVVRGESAEDLLSQTAPTTASTGVSPPGHVQRMLAQDLATAHLGAQKLAFDGGQLSGDPFVGPTVRHELFSAPQLSATFRFGVRVEEPLRLAFNPGRQPDESLPAGLQDGVIHDGILANTHPEISAAAGATFEFGADGHGNPRQALLRDIADSLYTSGVPAEQTYAGTYARGGVDEAFQARGAGSHWITIRAQHVEVSGTHAAITESDGQLYAKLAARRAPDPFKAILTNEAEATMLVVAMSEMGPAAWPPVFAWLRSNIFHGDVHTWVASAGSYEQQVFIHTMQRLALVGIAQAATDLAAYNAAARAILGSASTPEPVRARVREALAAGPSTTLATISAPGTGSFPTTGAANAPTSDAQYDAFRLSGLAAAQSRLIPTLSGTLSPTAFINAYPIQSRHTPMSDLSDATRAETGSIAKRIVAFMNAQESLSIPGASMNAAALATEAQKIGQIEAITEWAMTTPGDIGLLRMVAARVAMGDIHAASGAAATASAPSHLSFGAAANAADTTLSSAIGTTASSLKSVAESRKRTSHADTLEYVRADSLVDYYSNLESHSTADDLRALRAYTGVATVALATSATMQDIRGALANQAGAAQAIAYSAFEEAHTRYEAELIHNIESKIASHLTGEPYAAAGLLAAKSLSNLNSLRAGIMDVVAETTTQASRVIKMAGARVAIAGVCIEIGMFVHNWWARDRLAAAKHEILTSAQSQMRKFRATALTQIHAQASDEVAAYAAGHVRDGDAFSAFVGGLLAGTPGSPGRFVDLNAITEPGALLAIYNAILQQAVLPYNEVYEAMSGAIATNASSLWADYESQIDNLPNVIT